jgi:hypothetical protein
MDLFVYAIEKQYEVSNIGWAELETAADGTVYIQGYRTEAEAAKRMAEMVPAGEDPWVYAGLRVVRKPNAHAMFVVA